MIAPVVLRGGRGDGTVVEVDTARTVYVFEVAILEKTYPPGTWAVADGDAVVATVVEFDTYERVGVSTFEYLVPSPPEPLL